MPAFFRKEAAGRGPEIGAGYGRPHGRRSDGDLFIPSGPRGIESYLAELCELLAPRVAVLAPPQRDGEALPSDLAYPTTPGPGSMLWPSKAVTAAIVENARRYRTNKIIFGTPWPLALLGPRLRAAGLRYSVIVHGAELTVPAAVPLLRRLVARALGDAELLLPVSDYTAQQPRRCCAACTCRCHRRSGCACADIDRFRPGLDAGDVRSRLGLNERSKIVLCFGRLVPRKGVDRLIAVMPQVAEAVPGATLVVGGMGPEEAKLRALARRVGAPVVFAGRAADEDAPVVYSTADVFALPVVDRWFGLEIEGLGVVLLEASACETPCVTGRSGEHQKR